MRIGELCSRTGYNKDTIRIYEKIGLLPVERHGRGFKDYTDWHELRLLHIKYAKAAGFTLSQMRDLLTDWVAGTLSNAEKQVILADQIQKVDTAMDELQRVRRYLNQKMTLLVEEPDEAFAEEMAIMS